MTSVAIDDAVRIARGWLSSGKAPPNRAAEVARALALLSHHLPPTAPALKDLGPDLEAALLQEADDQQAVELVAAMAEHAADRAVAKQAKKVLFKLKQKGVTIPVRGQSRAPVDLAARPEPLPSFASSVDAAGGQLIFLGGWHPTDGPWCVMAMVTDRDGLLSAYYVAGTSRTQQKELIGRLRNQINGFTVEVPSDFAAGRLRWALDQRDRHDKIFEGDVAEVRRLLQGVDPLEEIEFTLDPEDEARLPAMLAASDALLSEGCFTGWFDPGKAQLDQLLGELRALPESDREEAALRLRDELWDKWFAEQDLARLASRLELNAWLLHCVQKPTAAMQAVACSRSLRSGRNWREIALVAQTVDTLVPLSSLRQA